MPGVPLRPRKAAEGSEQVGSVVTGQAGLAQVQSLAVCLLHGQLLPRRLFPSLAGVWQNDFDFGWGMENGAGNAGGVIG